MIIKISICFLLLILFSCQTHSSNKNYIKFKIPEQEIKITHHDSSSTNLKSFLNLSSSCMTYDVICKEYQFRTYLSMAHF